MKWVAQTCGCSADVSMGQKRPKTCDHGNVFQRPGAGPKPRKAMKRGRGFAASPAQRGKVRGLPCVSCGRAGNEYLAIDPAHLWPRGKGGCDHPDCVIPLCRGCHRLFDEGKLELLPSLIDRGYWREMAHPIAEHQVSPYTLTERLSHREEVEEAAA